MVAKHPPLRALILSLAALTVPVAGAFWVPEAFADYEALLWLVAVLPAFLLAYYKGWRGVTASLAGAMALVSVTYAITQATGQPMPDLLVAVVVIIVLFSLAIGVFAKRMRPEATTGTSPYDGYTDPGTGLPNRSHAELHLQLEFEAAQRGHALSVVMLDVDNFKGYNTRHGAIAGDEVLRLVGDVLRKTTRRANLAARFSDDGFVCVLGGAEEDGAVAFVHRFQQVLHEAARQRPLPPVSGGVAAYNPSMISHEDLLAAAGTALRQAKKEGRGRIRVHGRKLNIPFAPGEAEKPAEEPTDTAEQATTSVMPHGRGRGRKALIVAEQAPVRALLARYLTDLGFAVSQVSNVVDGVQSLTIEYDLLFTDISLNEGIGAELVRAAKLRWPSIQVVGLVPEPDSTLMIETLNSGVDRYIVTPLDLLQVRHHMTELLGRRDRLVASVLESRQLSMEFQARTQEAVEALRQSEEEYRSITRSVHEVVFRTDTNRVFTELNEAWTETTGFSVNASVGRPAADFAHADDRAEFSTLLTDLSTGRRADARGEVRVVAADGEVRWFELRATQLFDTDSRVSGIAGTLEDVTARKLAEDALRRSEARSRGLLAAIPDRVTPLSSSAELTEHFPSSAVPALRELMERAVRTGEVQVHEYSVAEDEFEVRLAAGGEENVVAIVRDITERKSLEEQLRQSQKLDSIGRLAGGLAHDFNNLLTVMQGNAHMLKEEPNLSTSASEYVEQIAEAAERGATLVRQLLAFGRRQVMKPSVLNLNTVVEDTRSMLARLIGEHIRLEVDLDPDLAMIKADAGQIQQVLVNLAVNARQAMREGGLLRIATRNAIPALHTGSTEAREDDVVLLTISDNGPGMDEETRQHVFEPFFTPKDPTDASGLGLATAYGIVRQSGGTITVLSEPGRGTSFEIALPRAGS
jgi:diguanylate cyclase (GGDEF)-like protein/PAS domain S-box-containing protein